MTCIEALVSNANVLGCRCLGAVVGCMSRAEGGRAWACVQIVLFEDHTLDLRF